MLTTSIRHFTRRIRGVIVVHRRAASDIKFKQESAGMNSTENYGRRCLTSLSRHYYASTNIITL